MVIKIEEDGLTASNEKGYRMARSSYGLKQGTFYFEVEKLNDLGNVRVGWAQEKSDSEGLY
jgi:hypothetical protein